MSKEGHSTPKFESPHTRGQALTVRFAGVIILRLFSRVSIYYQMDLLERVAIQGNSPPVFERDS